MDLRLNLPYPLPHLIQNPAQASDVLVSGAVEFSYGLDSTVSSLIISLVQTLRFQAHKPDLSTSLLHVGLNKQKGSNAEEAREIERWCFSHPSTSNISPTHKAIPFTIAIPGYLPATTETPIASLSYHVRATITISTATCATSHATSKPIHIRRLLSLPLGLTAIDYRHRFLDSHVETLLSVPAIFQPLDTYTPRLTLLSCTGYWLRVHKLHWRIEECTRILTRTHNTEGESGLSGHELNRHVRTIISGDHHIAPTGRGSMAVSDLSELQNREILFDITVPEKARLACTLMHDLDMTASGAREENLPEYTPSSHCQFYGRPQCRSLDGEGQSGMAKTILLVSHTLVLDIVGKEIKVDSETGEQLSLGPQIPRTYGARYGIMVSDWTHCGEAGNERYEIPPPPESASRAVSPPPYESIIEE